MSSNLAGILTETAAEHGDRPALKLDDTVVTYDQLDDGSARVVALLRDKGIEPGDRVGIMLPNVPYFGVIYYGILRAGGVVVPMNPLLKGREVKFYVEDPEHEAAVRVGRLRGGRRPGRRGGRRRADPRQAGRVRGARRELRARRRRRRARGRRHRRPALHLRHDRRPQGRRAHARQPAQELRDLRAHARRGRPRRTSCSARCRCSTPSGRRAGSTAPSPSARACR